MFKASNGVFFTKQLFFETCDSDKTNTLYTLKPEDHEYKGIHYPSIRRLYLEEGDLTEYSVAKKYFGGWPHWKKLLDCPWFMDYLSEFREELQVRKLAEAYLVMDQAVKKGSETAAKYLLDRGLIEKKPVGRPTKKAIKEEARRITDEALDIREDFQRILDEAQGSKTVQ